MGCLKQCLNLYTDDPCGSNPCLNGGTCVDQLLPESSGNSVYCSCAVDFTGKFCSGVLKGGK